MSLRSLRSAVAEWSPAGAARPDPIASVLASWPELVGRALAEHTRPLSVAGDTLLIVTRSGAWSQQLSLLADRVLDGLRDFPELAAVRRLRFRVGQVRAARQLPVRAAASPRSAGKSDPEPLPEAASAQEAFERLRFHVAARLSQQAVCPACGAPGTQPHTCAPCEAKALQRRVGLMQRLMYDAPWLGYDGMARLVDGLEPVEYESVRRHLLGRWWEMLSRCRWTKRVTTLERRVASSYVLLQSQLEPDHVTPTVVRNLLGDELAALLDRSTGRADRGGAGSPTLS